jgi:transposase-like protein
MPKQARVGDFCPNPDCDDHSKLQGEGQTNIIRFGKTKAGRQRYKCKTCNGTFVETKGTIFYRRRTSEEEIIDTLTLIAEDSRISSLARAKGHKEETIIDWIRAAGEHAEKVEEMLLAEHQIKRGQLDGLWAYIRNKGEKKTTPKPTKPANSGALHDRYG